MWRELNRSVYYSRHADDTTHPIVNCGSLTYPSVACLPPFLSAMVTEDDISNGRGLPPDAVLVCRRLASAGLPAYTQAEVVVARKFFQTLRDAI